LIFGKGQTMHTGVHARISSNVGVLHGEQSTMDRVLRQWYQSSSNIILNQYPQDLILLKIYLQLASWFALRRTDDVPCPPYTRYHIHTRSY